MHAHSRRLCPKGGLTFWRARSWSTLCSIPLYKSIPLLAHTIAARRSMVSLMSRGFTHLNTGDISLSRRRRRVCIYVCCATQWQHIVICTTGSFITRASTIVALFCGTRCVDLHAHTAVKTCGVLFVDQQDTAFYRGNTAVARPIWRISEDIDYCCARTAHNLQFEPTANVHASIVQKL